MQRPIVAEAAANSPSEINLTPMLDVVFIMLIFFLVTASFLKESGLDINRSDVAPAPPESVENIQISIEEDDGIWMGKRLIDPRALRANIKRMQAANPDATVVIQAHRRSANKTLVQIMDSSRQAGVYQISLAHSED